LHTHLCSYARVEYLDNLIEKTRNKGKGEHAIGVTFKTRGLPDVQVLGEVKDGLR
jgi:hypothetical protein